MKTKKYITFHYKGRLLSKYITDDAGIQKILDRGNRIVLEGLRKGQSLSQCIITFTNYLNLFYQRRTNGKRVTKTDHDIFTGVLLALMKCKRIVEDDRTGYIITKYKHRKLSSNI